MDEKARALIEAWDEGHWELTLAFEGLDDSDLWARPHPSLLSVGELAGHVAYGEAQMIEGGCDSPLVDSAFDYYLRQVASPVAKDLTVSQVLQELERVHTTVKAKLEDVSDFDAKVPWRSDWTWRGFVRYQVFHVAYHCGQAFSARHLMGHKTNDN